MGADKALIEVDGRAMVMRVVDALRAAAADPIVVVGGDRESLTALGLAVVPDTEPDAGPAAATATALDAVPGAVVVVAACDLPRVDGATVTELVNALHEDEQATVVVPVVDGRRQYHLLAWRRSAQPKVAQRVRDGVRSMHELLDGPGVVDVVPHRPAALRDVDRPEDL